MTGVLARARELDDEYMIFNALSESDDSTGRGLLECTAISVKDNIRYRHEEEEDAQTEELAKQTVLLPVQLAEQPTLFSQQQTYLPDQE